MSRKSHSSSEAPSEAKNPADEITYTPEQKEEHDRREAQAKKDNAHFKKTGEVAQRA